MYMWLQFFAFWEIFHDFFCRLQIFFKVNFFQKFISGTLAVSQTALIQIRPDIQLALIWVQIVCKDQQQMSKFAAGRQRLKAW